MFCSIPHVHFALNTRCVQCKEGEQLHRKSIGRGVEQTHLKANIALRKLIWLPLPQEVSDQVLAIECSLNNRPSGEDRRSCTYQAGNQRLSRNARSAVRTE